MNVNQVFGTVNAPTEIANLTKNGGAAGIGGFLSTIVNFMIIIGGTGFVIMLVVAGLQWVFSGGSKEKIASAQARITWAVIGLILLALARLIIAVLENVLNFKIVR